MRLNSLLALSRVSSIFSFMADYSSMTACEIAAAVRDGSLRAVDITHDALDLAESTGKELNAFITLCNRSALAQAEAVDKAVAAGTKGASPLCGVPIAIKDNICVRDHQTTCASRMLENFVSPYSATVVERLVEAGAVIIGKTNMDEFAMGSSNETSYFGPVLNPHNRKLVPGGSSGGSAAAVAAGIVPLALGSDTGGSVRQPAAFCGVLGLKPTWGAVSRYGLVAFASSTDQIGPLARTTEDLALLYSVLAGHDENDATSAEMDPYDAVTTLDIDRPLTVGIPREYFGDGLDPELHGWAKRLLHDLQEIGHTIAEVSLPLTDPALAAYYIIANAEASSNLARYDGARYGLRVEGDGSLNDMYAATRAAGFGREVKRRIMLGTHVLSTGYYDDYYLRAARVREKIRAEFDRAFSEVDLLISPTTPTPSFRLGEKLRDPLEMYRSDIYTVPASLAGIPAISVPFGRSSDGRPIGVQFMADRFNEHRVFQIAHTVEGLHRLCHT